MGSTGTFVSARQPPAADHTSPCLLPTVPPDHDPPMLNTSPVDVVTLDWYPRPIVMAGPRVQVFAAGSYRLVFVLLLPPLTMIRPSGSIEVPGQNMSWAVLATAVRVTALVERFRMDVWV